MTAADTTATRACASRWKPTPGPVWTGAWLSVGGETTVAVSTSCCLRYLEVCTVGIEIIMGILPFKQRLDTEWCPLGRLTQTLKCQGDS